MAQEIATWDDTRESAIWPDHSPIRHEYHGGGYGVFAPSYATLNEPRTGGAASNTVRDLDLGEIAFSFNDTSPDNEDISEVYERLSFFDIVSGAVTWPQDAKYFACLVEQRGAPGPGVDVWHYPTLPSPTDAGVFITPIVSAADSFQETHMLAVFGKPVGNSYGIGGGGLGLGYMLASNMAPQAHSFGVYDFVEDEYAITTLGQGSEEERAPGYAGSPLDIVGQWRTEDEGEAEYYSLSVEKCEIGSLSDHRDIDDDAVPDGPS